MSTFIPKKCRVGWQHREDTFTRKLSYIVPYSEKGVLRQEPGWKAWLARDKNPNDPEIAPRDFDNVPFDGFFLNKGIKRGGYDSFSQVVQKVRVYDPRCGGMEFEITISNLLYILMHDDCTKRELTGKYVYGWAGKDIMLLPVSSEDYVKAVESTGLRDMSVKKKDLVPGYHYITKQEAVLMYVGEFHIYDNGSDYGSSGYQTSKRFAFTIVSGHMNNNRSLKESDYGHREWVFLSGLTSLAKVHSESPSEELPEKTQQFLESRFNKGKIDEILPNSVVPSFSYPPHVSTDRYDRYRNDDQTVTFKWIQNWHDRTTPTSYLVRISDKVFQRWSTMPNYPSVPFSEDEEKEATKQGYYYSGRGKTVRLPFGESLNVHDVLEITISNGYLETKSKKLDDRNVSIDDLRKMEHVSLDLKVNGKIVTLNDYLNNKI